METSRQALEAAIRARPADPQPRLVLADLLQQEGDPAGTLITLQHEMGRDSHRIAAAEQYLTTHRQELFGELPVQAMQLSWFLGSLRAVTFRSDLEPPKVATAIDRLPTLTIGRFVEELEVKLEPAADPSPVFAALSQGGFESLQRLKIDGGRAGDFSAVWPALASLQSLDLTQQKTLGTVSAPSLRALSLTVASEGLLDALTAGGLDLESLGLNLTALPPGSICALVERQTRLRSLYLRGRAVTDALCTELAKVLARRKLSSLVLTGGQLTILGARALASAGLQLEHLDVSHNRLEPTAKAVLMRVCPAVSFGHQEHDGAEVEPVRRGPPDGWVVLSKPKADPDLPMRAAAMLGKHHGVRALILESAPEVELAQGKPCTVLRILGLGDKSFMLDEFAESLARRTETLRRAERYQVLCLHHAPHTSAAWRLFGPEGKLGEGAGAQAEVVSDGLQRLLEAPPRADFLERLATAGELRTVIWNHAPAPGRAVEGTRDAYRAFATMDIDFAPPEAEPGDQLLGECSDCREQAELYECEDCHEDFCANCLREPEDRSAWVCRGCGQGARSGEHAVEIEE